MAIGNPAVIGSGENSSFVTTVAATGCIVPANSLVVVCVAHSGTASITDPTGVSDGTNALIKFNTGVTRANENVTVWYRYYSSGATLTFTASFSSSSLSGITVCSVANADSISPTDEYGTGNNFGTAVSATTAGTCDQADELAFQLAMISQTTAFSAWPSAGYTSLTNSIGDGSRSHRFAFAYLNGVTAAATQTATATAASSCDWVEIVATFRGGVAPVDPSISLPLPFGGRRPVFLDPGSRTRQDSIIGEPSQQRAHPSFDNNTVGWTRGGIDSGALFSQISEAAPGDDADYITSTSV